MKNLGADDYEEDKIPEIGEGYFLGLKLYREPRKRLISYEEILVYFSLCCYKAANRYVFMLQVRVCVHM